VDITVIGASGETGRQAVARALAAGHRVTAVVRRPDVIEPANRLRVVVVPNLTVASNVDRVIAGSDAVISALGPSVKGPTSVCTEGVRAVLAAMGRTGVRRLVAVSAYGAGESRDRSLYSRLLWAAVAEKMRDKNGMEQLIRASDAEWTIGRPPALRSGPYTGSYRAGTDLKVRLTTRISRADLADFLLCEAVAPAWVGQTPVIAA